MSENELMDALGSMGAGAGLAVGETLFSVGERCENIYVIVSGRVKCTAPGKADIERESGDVLCLIDAVGGTSCSRTCIALDDVQLLVIPSQQLINLIDGADNIMAMTMKATAMRVAIAQEGAPA